MAKSNLSVDLRRAIKERIKKDGQTLNVFAKSCGIDHAALWRFMKGHGINLSTAEVLAGYLGMRLTDARSRR